MSLYNLLKLFGDPASGLSCPPTHPLNSVRVLSLLQAHQTRELFSYLVCVSPSEFGGHLGVEVKPPSTDWTLFG